MADISVVFDKLKGFETADELAEFFRGYGVKARPGRARACAISKFVVEETGVMRVCSDANSVCTYEANDLGNSPIVTTLLCTEAMAEFIRKYDRGCYPSLIEEGFEINCTKLS